MQNESAAGKTKGFLRILAGCSLQLSWLPVAYYITHITWHAATFDTLGPLLAFLACFALVVGVVQFTRRIIKEHPRWILFLQCLLVVLGLILALVDAQSGLTGKALCLVAFSLLGSGSALSAVLWEQALLEQSRKRFVLYVLVLLTVFSCAFSLSAYLSLVVCCILAAATFLTSSLLWTQDKDQGQEEKPVQSHMLHLMSRQLLIRYFSSFALLGLCSGAMLSLFASGLATPPSMKVTDFAVLGVVFMTGLLVLGWVRNREYDFIFTFSLLVLAAVIAFFPINPGTVFNQHIALIIGEAWLVVLFGNLLLMSREIDVLSSYARKDSLGLGYFGLFLGMAIGVFAMYMVLLSPWYRESGLGSIQEIEFATTCGATTLAVSYLCTNILLNKDFIQAVKLATKGRFAASIQLSLNPEPQSEKREQTEHEPKDVHAYETRLQASSKDIEANCRAITFEKGLTPREYEVLVILAQGNSLARVQSELFISEGTAITHRRNIYRKLLVHSKQELLDYASNYGEGKAILWQG
jgi:DNA-binding CsgD family transcriptional regulator